MGENIVKVLVLSVSKWTMTENGQVSTGATVQYCYTDDFKPIVASESLKGYKVAKASVPFTDYDKFTSVPGFYTAKQTVTVNSALKPVVNLADFTFDSSLDVVPFDKKGVK